jgi:tetratricopeptide (TPR) repeat protein
MIRMSTNRESCLVTAILFFALWTHGQINPAQNTQQNASTERASETEGHPDLVAEAKALLRSGRFDEAAQRYNQLLQVQPKSAEAYAGLTRVYLKQRKLQQAHDTIMKGLAVTDSALLHVALGEVLFREARLEQAQTEWLNVVNSGHADARSHLGLAKVSAATTNYKQAKTEIDTAYALDPEDPDIELDWFQYLKPTDQVPYLEGYLSHQSGLKPEEQSHLRNYLESLKARLNGSNPCRLATEVASAETNLTILSTPGYGLGVALNGQTSKLQLDTGASGIVVDQRTAKRVGLKKLSNTSIGGFGDKGESTGYFALANSIKIGELEFRDCPVVVLDTNSVLGDFSEDGLIGTDVFQDFLIDLDFPNQKLRLGQLPPRFDLETEQLSLRTAPAASDSLEEPIEPSARSTGANSAVQQPYTSLTKRFFPPAFSLAFTPVFRFGHLLLVPAEVGDLPTTKLFVIDTGSSRNMFSVQAAREITKVESNPRRTVEGLSGKVKKVYSARKTAVHFANVQQYADNDIAIDLESQSDKIGTELSGVLGVYNLRTLDLTIDYRDGLVGFSFMTHGQALPHPKP